MDAQVIDLLVKILGDQSSSLNELLAKMSAAEKVFESRNPEAYKEYRKYFDSLKKTGASQQLAQALAMLREKLMES